MVLGTVIRYGLPLSFLHCSVYIQDVWREGDEQLKLEQKRTWKNFFRLIDTSYSAVISKLSPSTQENVNQLNLVAKLESMDMKKCWNARVMSAFSALERASLKSIKSSIPGYNPVSDDFAVLQPLSQISKVLATGNNSAQRET